MNLVIRPTYTQINNCRLWGTESGLQEQKKKNYVEMAQKKIVYGS